MRGLVVGTGIREGMAKNSDQPCQRIAVLNDVQPSIWNERHEIGHHNVRQMRVSKRDGLVACERQSDEWKVCRPKADLDVAVPELTVFIIENIVRCNINKGGSDVISQAWMIEAGCRKW